MNVFVIGCLHFGHENMARWRGFRSSEEHDNHLIEQWNKTVNKRSKVFILGDVTMESSDHYYKLGKLLGNKHVILGNHDKATDVPKLLQYCMKVSGPQKYKQMWLTHIPVHPIEFDYRIKLNIHAHIHHLDLNDPRYFHADAARLDFKPISIETIINNYLPQCQETLTPERKTTVKE